MCLEGELCSPMQPPMPKRAITYRLVICRNRPPIIDTNDMLTKEVAMLDTLTDMEVANTIMKTSSDRHKDGESVSQIDKRFEQLKLTECEALDPKSGEYQGLKQYLINTAGHTHNIRYRLQDIFRIEREGEDERFQKSKFAKIKDRNRRLLWHGSRTTNYGESGSPVRDADC